MKLLVILFALCAVAHSNPVPKFDGRIVGGLETTIEEFPYQASVRYKDQHICGGSIIDEYSILTAAHCVHDMDHSQFSVRVGATKHLQGHTFIVKHVKKNQNYDPDLTDNDAAILILRTPLTFSNKIKAIPLQASGEEVSSGTAAYVTGWGVLQEGGSIIPANLRVVSVDVVSNDFCQLQYNNVGARITSHMMCAQSAGKDSCQGDSGGPLAADGKLIGVVSWGFGCARPQYPGVYAKVSDLHKWIVDNQHKNNGSKFSMSVVTLVFAIFICSYL